MAYLGARPLLNENQSKKLEHENSVEEHQNSPKLHKVIHIIAHGNEQIEKQRAPSLHLHLHGSTPREQLPGLDNHFQVMRAESIFRVRRVVVRVPGRPQNDIDGDAALQALFAERETLESLQPVLFRGTVHDCVPEDLSTQAEVENGWLARSPATGTAEVLGILKFPGVLTPTAEQTWVVVSSIKELEDAGQNLGFSGGLVSESNRASGKEQSE